MQKHIASWRSPSNIALIKYWGKKGEQIPANASLSFTLSACFTETSVKSDALKDSDKTEIEVFFSGVKREDFKGKIDKLLERLGSEADFLKGQHLEIKTMNSFPHSSGIASSASGMSALVLCLLSLKEILTGEKDPEFFMNASRWSRLASGSASRSVYGGTVLWGPSAAFPGGNNEYSVPIGDRLHPDFKKFKDYVLIVERGQKAVSSSAGHGLMENHPYASARFEQAAQNLESLTDAMKKGDLEQFGAIVESEALQLHSMMMTSRPYYLLMKPNTLAVIEKIWELRRIKNIPVYFSMDAGANVHMLFPKSEEKTVTDFLQSEMLQLLQEGEYIADEVGNGPEQLF